MIDELLRLLAPHSCLSCRRVNGILCRSCLMAICDEILPFCIGCGLATTTSGQMCIDCADDWPVDRAFVAVERGGVVEELINEFKYSHKREAYKSLAMLATVALPVNVSGTIIPVPTIARHIRERGYDHARLIARAVARRCSLRYAPLLRRVTNTVQHGASKRQRSEQAEKTFKVTTTLDPNTIYIVFDDIVTTGASLKAAARELRRAGARTVWALAIARQPLDKP